MATHRSTVNISLAPEPDGFLGHEQESDEAFRELKAKLAQGAEQAERGKLLGGDEVFDELRQMIEERRRGELA